MIVKRSRREHALVARVRSEHLHGLRVCSRSLLRLCELVSAVSLLSTWPSSVCFPAAEAGIVVVGHSARGSCAGALPRLISLLGFRSCVLTDCLAGRVISFAAAISRLCSLLSAVLAIAGLEPSSSSPEPEGRLLIERYAGQVTQHPEQQWRSSEGACAPHERYDVRTCVRGGWQARALWSLKGC